MVTPKMLFWGPKIEVPRWANPGLRQSRHVARRDTSGHVRGTPIVGRLGLAELINGNLWGESTTTGAGELSSISMNKHRTGIAGVATGAKSKALSHMTGCPMAQSLVDVAGAFPKPLTGALNLPAGPSATTFAISGQTRRLPLRPRLRP